MLFIGQDRMDDRYTISTFLVEADTFEEAKEIYKYLMEKNLSELNPKIYETENSIGYSYDSKDLGEIDGWLSNKEVTIYNKNDIKAD